MSLAAPAQPPRAAVALPARRGAGHLLDRGHHRGGRPARSSSSSPATLEPTPAIKQRRRQGPGARATADAAADRLRPPGRRAVHSAPNTDTMMLVRLDADSQTINVLSVPRDLQVDDPRRRASTKLNAAYSLGGPNLLIKTIKTRCSRTCRSTTSSTSTSAASRTWSTRSAASTPTSTTATTTTPRYTDYSSIDIQPGYQKLCGDDIGRARWPSCASATPTPTSCATPASRTSCAGPRTSTAIGQLLANRDKLLRIFGRNAQTDPTCTPTTASINLFNLVAFSAGHRIKQIQFPAILHAVHATGLLRHRRSRLPRPPTFRRPSCAPTATRRRPRPRPERRPWQGRTGTAARCRPPG